MTEPEDTTHSTSSPTGDADQQFRFLLDSVQDYAFLFFDLQGRVLSWNLGAERVLGYRAEEVVGQPGEVFFTPEDRAQGKPQQEFAQASAEGRAEDERWHIRRDGSRFWASGVMTLLRDGQGQPQGFGKVMRDLTEWKLAEERLRESEERFRLFMQNVHDCALFQVDLDARISGWNPGAARIFGYEAAEVLGKPLTMLFPPERQAELMHELGEALARGGAEDECWLTRKDGTQIYGRWVTNPMRDAAGQLRGFAKVLRDETASKRAEEARLALEQRERETLRVQAESADEALDRTKEELRALATGLLTIQEEERRRVARELHDDLAQRLALIEINLVQLRHKLPSDSSHLHDGLTGLEQEVVALSAEVRTLSHQLHPAILEDLGLATALQQLVEEQQVGRREAIRLVTSNVPPHIPVPVAAALYRITQEALRNTAKHAPQSPVYVTLAGESGLLRLTVKDAGPGFLAAAVRGKAGLGLISMQERANLVGGSYQVISAPGEGTTVEVRVFLQSDSLQERTKR